MTRFFEKPRILLVSAGVLAGVLGGGIHLTAVAVAQPQPPPAPEGRNPVDAYQRELVRVSRRGGASIVTIEAQLDPQPASVTSPLPGDAARRRVGSGILVDASGSIITTYSNIKGAYALFVRTGSGQLLTATLVGADRATNIALVQARNVPGQPAHLGESGLVPPGTAVVVAGGAQKNMGIPASSFGAVEVDGGLFVRYSGLELFVRTRPLSRAASGAPSSRSTDGWWGWWARESAPPKRPGRGSRVSSTVTVSSARTSQTRHSSCRWSRTRR